MLLVYDMRLVSSFQNVSVAMHHILFMITRAVWEATNNLTKIRGVSWFFNTRVKRLIINCHGYFIDKKMCLSLSLNLLWV